MEDPRGYLTQIYSPPLDAASIMLLKFFYQTYSKLEGGKLLEFGGGPTIYSLISASRFADEIHFCDHSESALGEVQDWLGKKSNAFEWSCYVRAALSIELMKNQSEVTNNECDIRECLIRQKVKSVSRCDAYADDILLNQNKKQFDAVANNFCLEGITSSLRVWEELNGKLSQLVKPGGLYVTCAIRNAESWGSETTRYPAVNLKLSDIVGCYKKLGFEDLVWEMIDLDGRQGYDGMIAIAGRKTL